MLQSSCQFGVIRSHNVKVKVTKGQRLTQGIYKEYTCKIIMNRVPCLDTRYRHVKWLGQDVQTKSGTQKYSNIDQSFIAGEKSREKTKQNCWLCRLVDNTLQMEVLHNGWNTLNKQILATSQWLTWALRSYGSVQSSYSQDQWHRQVPELRRRNSCPCTFWS